MNEKKIIQFPTPEARQKKELEKTLEPVAPIFEEAEEEREVSVEKEIGGSVSASRRSAREKWKSPRRLLKRIWSGSARKMS
jgi:hypothetical protein